MSHFGEAMWRYKEAFGYGFPTECCGLSEAEMIRAMNECIEKGEPYDCGIEPEYDENGVEIDIIYG